MSKKTATREAPALQVPRADVIADPVEDLQRQHEYAQKMASGADMTMAIAQAFADGMRQIGYKSTVTALNELIDNAIQAAARKVVIGIDVDKGDVVQRIVVADNGHGMEPAMIRLAATWGGTHRAASGTRTGFGRFGFGLPTASISQARRYTIISKLAGGSFHGVAVDIDDLAKGAYRTERGTVELPKATPIEPDEFVKAHLDKSFGDFESGTIIVLERFDRLSWGKGRRLRVELVSQLGVYYRNFIGDAFALFVGAKEVKRVDPLFQDPEGLYFGAEGDNAAPQETVPLRVKTRDGNIGLINVRLSYFSPTFAHKTKTGPLSKDEEDMNERWPIIRQYNEGIIVCRAGRQIDVVKPKFRKLTHKDFSWAMEIDFPPALDDEFNISTHKQHVRLDEKIWTALQKAHYDVRIGKLVTRSKNERAALNKGDNPTKKSERAGARVRREDGRASAPYSPTEKAELDERFNREVERRAANSGMRADDVRKALLESIEAEPVQIVEQHDNEGPFYRLDQMMSQLRIVINRDHNFYSRFYAAESTSPESRQGFDLLLLALAIAESHAREKRRTFYETERVEWSRYLREAVNAFEEESDDDDDTTAMPTLPGILDNFKADTDFVHVDAEQDTLSEAGQESLLPA